MSQDILTHTNRCREKKATLDKLGRAVSCEVGVEFVAIFCGGKRVALCGNKNREFCVFNKFLGDRKRILETETLPPTREIRILLEPVEFE